MVCRHYVAILAKRIYVMFWVCHIFFTVDFVLNFIERARKQGFDDDTQCNFTQETDFSEPPPTPFGAGEEALAGLISSSSQDGLRIWPWVNLVRLRHIYLI
jgi:hypothetical protein